MTTHYQLLRNRDRGFLLSLLALLVFAVLGYTAAHYMDSNGHHVSGMNNQVVWGLPHVFAILLILGASGSLNVASVGTVFGRPEYKPWGRLSALLSVALLIGGLLVLVLDLGRPERLVIAMTHFNFKSVFAWNVLLYTGFLGVLAVYLWTMIERSADRFLKPAAILAVGWRFVLTSGTGAIFGFLVARQFYDAAILVPLFIALSLVVGCAVFILVGVLVARWSGAQISPQVVSGLVRMLCLFLMVELLMVAAFHLTNLYSAEHQGIERFILLGGGHYTLLFWLGQIVVGSLLPLWLVYARSWNEQVSGALMVAGLAIGGAVCHLYVTIIGGQAYPLVLFPGKDVSSSFFDGVVARYSPSLPELLLGLGGVALSLLILIAATRVLPLLPRTGNEQPVR